MGEQYQIIPIDDSTWSIEDDFVRFFLLKGEEKALLIDSGVDIENVSRLDKYVDNKALAVKLGVFTDNEIEYCFKKGVPSMHLAARFCAKEAIFKALSGFGEKGIEFNKLEIYHEDDVPCVRFLNSLREKYKVKLSLSHDKTKASAYVMIYISDEDRVK